MNNSKRDVCAFYPGKRTLQRLCRCIVLIPGLLVPLACASESAVGFGGNITSPSCAVFGGGGASGTGNALQVEGMNSSVAVLTDGRTWAAHGKRFHLLVVCPGNMSGYSLARASFDPAAGSGFHPQDRQLLQLTGDSTASDVGLALWNADTAMLDLSASPTVTGTFTTVGELSTTQIELGAIFARTSSTPTGGVAKATLPFSLTYE